MIKQAAEQYLYSVSGRLIEDWNAEELRTHLQNRLKGWKGCVPHEVYECMKEADIIFEVLHLDKVMSEVETITAYIPFQGFYESHISGYLEDEIEYSDQVEPKSWIEVHTNIAKVYAEKWRDITGFPVKFSRLISPREYNFETDKIEVEVPVDWVTNLRCLLLVSEGFREYVFEICRSRSGFFSFLNNNLDMWPRVWGHKEVTVALQYLERAIGEIEEQIIEDMNCNGDFQW